MIVDCISDLHGFKPKLEGGDLLIVAGDCTARDIIPQWKEFFTWLDDQEYERIVFIAGNHDGSLQISGFVDDCLAGTCRIDYLCDSSAQVEDFKIWGAPWTPEFCGWHFMLPRGEELKKKWGLIPDDTDILITHGPPWGVLDKVCNHMSGKEQQGCVDLRAAVERVRPKLHVFGHIHEGYGQILYKHEGENTICVNASIMDRYYQPVNNTIRIKL